MYTGTNNITLAQQRRQQQVESNLNVIEFLQKKKGGALEDHFLASLSGAKAEIPKNKGNEVWSVYEGDQDYFDTEGKRYSGKGLFLKTEIKWTITLNSGRIITHKQTVFTNVPIPHEQAGVEATNQAKRRARVLVGAYIHAYADPFQTDDLEEKKKKIDKIALQTWLKVKIPCPGEGLEDYDIQVFLPTEGVGSKPRELVVFSLYEKVTMKPYGRFSCSEKTVVRKKKFDDEADRGRIKRASGSGYYFQEEIEKLEKYRKLDLMVVEKWYKKLQKLDSEGLQNYFNHLRQEMKQIERECKKIKLFLVGDRSGLMAQIGQRVPYFKKKFNIEALLKYERKKQDLAKFSKDTSKVCEKGYQETCKQDYGEESKEYKELLFVNQRKQDIEFELQEYIRKVHLEREELKEIKKDLKIVKNKFMRYISSDILEINGGEQSLNEKNVREALSDLSEENLVEWKKKVLRDYLNVCRMFVQLNEISVTICQGGIDRIPSPKDRTMCWDADHHSRQAMSYSSSDFEEEEEEV